jgi:hypothetical protein
MSQHAETWLSLRGEDGGLIRPVCAIPAKDGVP